MDARAILDRLSQAGVSVVVEAGRIRCRPASAIPDALRALVSARKGELIKLLEQPTERLEFGKTSPGSFLPPLKPAPWLHSGPTRVRMAAPAPGEDATHDDAIKRREAHFRARWAGVDPPCRLVDLPADTCLVCGCHPIARRGDYHCALCEEAAANVLAERSARRAGARAAIESVFGEHPCTHVPDFDAFRDLCRRRWPDVPSDERLELSLEFLADIIEILIEVRDADGQARARAVWDRLEAICERRRAGK